MRPYSEDLRVRMVETVRVGTSKSATAHLLGVSLSTVKRYTRLADRNKPLTSKRQRQSA